MIFKKSLKVIFVLALLQVGSAAMACDYRLAQSFPDECAIQDKYAGLKSQFASLGIDINYIAEYRALRFIGRAPWEKAVKKETPINEIYDPAPKTWETWSQGAAYLEQAPMSLGFTSDHYLIKQFNKYSISKDTMFKMKRSTRDEIMCPGVTRHLSKNDAGWTYKSAKKARAAKKQIADMGSDLPVELKADGKFIGYVAGKQVPQELANWQFNSQNSLDKVNQGLEGPIEAGAKMQRWLVAIHPFYDGNGRTSRLVQDYVSRSFNMPYAPTGDLSNDILSFSHVYVDRTKNKISTMLTLLDQCLAFHKGAASSLGNNLTYRCQILPRVSLMTPETCER